MPCLDWGWACFFTIVLCWNPEFVCQQLRGNHSYLPFVSYHSESGGNTSIHNQKTILWQLVVLSCWLSHLFLSHLLFHLQATPNIHCFLRSFPRQTQLQPDGCVQNCSALLKGNGQGRHVKLLRKGWSCLTFWLFWQRRVHCVRFEKRMYPHMQLFVMYFIIKIFYVIHWCS